MQDIDNLISDCINQINDKIIGINFLEKLKYLLIDKIKAYDISKLSSEVSQKSLVQNENINVTIKIEKNTKNVSKLKKMLNNDVLSIVLDGLQILTLHEKSNSSSNHQQYLTKFTGIVLPKNTIINELITKDTILLNITIFNEEDIIKA